MSVNESRRSFLRKSALALGAGIVTTLIAGTTEAQELYSPSPNGTQWGPAPGSPWGPPPPPHHGPQPGHPWGTPPPPHPGPQPGSPWGPPPHHGPGPHGGWGHPGDNVIIID